MKVRANFEYMNIRSFRKALRIKCNNTNVKLLLSHKQAWALHKELGVNIKEIIERYGIDNGKY